MWIHFEQSRRKLDEITSLQMVVLETLVDQAQPIARTKHSPMDARACMAAMACSSEVLFHL